MSPLLIIFLHCMTLSLSVTGKSNGNVSVVIIGAGPSGIAAGQRLYENGFDVTILEAENRIGGRVHSVKFGDAYVDLGAEWCHGEDDNIVYQMVKDLGVLTHSNYNYHLYFSDRTYISEEFDTELDDLFESTYSADGNRHQPINCTVEEYCIRIFNSTIRKQWGNNKEKFRTAMMCLETFHRYALSDEGSFSWADVPATNDYRNCIGDLEQNWSGFGFRTILAVLLKRFPRVDRSFNLINQIRINKEVTEIIYKDDFTVALCTDGSAYVADHIIFTPSLGVLKHQHMTLFNPPLSSQKVQVIEELGISAVIKVMLLFPSRWWPTGDFTGFSFVWTYEDKEMLNVEFPYGPRRHDSHWLRNIMCIFRLEKNPKALTVWFTGEFVPDIELMDESILIKGIVFTLNKFFGDKYRIPMPVKLVRGDWYSNPHFRGTYSYQTIPARTHFSPSPNLVLAEPVYNKMGIPRLLFAGEATHPFHYSTVHGAIETGYREADRLIKLY